MTAPFAIQVHRSIGEVDRSQWNAIADTKHPFVQHEFLSALEVSGSACAETGWAPRHLVMYGADGEILAALPLYLKNHSWGEFVFDQPWAQAYQQAGLRYYPRLVASVPFTPVAGPRVLCRSGQDKFRVTGFLVAKARQTAEKENASSLHVLFPQKVEIDSFRNENLVARTDCQFHWHNYDYASFDDFLAALTSTRRKKVKRERRKVTEAGYQFRFINGGSLTNEILDSAYQLHATTFAVRGQAPYLTPSFFREIAASMSSSMVLIAAMRNDVMEACAICFRDDEALYGRYWGTSNYQDSLHFETCYYQGIDYCIREGLKRFEPGAQGEHKLSRGFEPTETRSFHWLADTVFADAISRHLERERQWVGDYIENAREKLPFRETRGSQDHP